MKGLSRAVIVMGALAVGTAALAADDPVEQRHDLMETVGDSTKLVGQMIKGEIPFDSGKAVEALETINGVPDKFVMLFPEGSGDHPDTRAAPAVWEDMEDFRAKAEDLKTASAEAADAAAEGLDPLKASFGGMVDTCKGCHEAYRLEKD